MDYVGFSNVSSFAMLAPSSELGKHSKTGNIAKSNIVHLELIGDQFGAPFVGAGNNVIGTQSIDCLLELILLDKELMVLSCE